MADGAATSIDASNSPLIDYGRLQAHEKIVLLFSGGKDSLALIYLFREHLDRITILHLDAGDLLPEMRELVAKVEKVVPRFVRIQTDAPAWIAANGIPSDLVPMRAHPINRRPGDGVRRSIVPPFDCCLANRWEPMSRYIEESGATLSIHGQRRADPVPAAFWAAQNAFADRRWHPIEHWSDREVFAYLSEFGAPILPFYSYRTQAPECATCPAGWSEKRAAYLKNHHPDLAARYSSYLAAQAAEIWPAAELFMSERKALAPAHGK
jgi:3'-phosphoadenosine 5'-phosphosulfate sulfotransferase (PAPS reductase)/FAD synthetase